MSAPIFNRSEFEHPKDGWYQIEPAGVHRNEAAGLDQVIDAAARASIVSRFNADAAAGKLRHGSEMLIDHEHFKHDPEKETKAYGWGTQAQNRDDGIYMKIRWTATGQAAVDGGDYRYFSTEYDPSDLVVLNRDNPKRVRPMRLDGLTLTNEPNNKGGKPITNRAQPNRVGEHCGAAQRYAVKSIAEAAAAECSTGSSVRRAYATVMNREPAMAALASGKSMQELRPADFAGEILMEQARERPIGTLSQNLVYVRNRSPRLAKMLNRKDWDALEDLEPEARGWYSKVSSSGRDWRDFVFKKDDPEHQDKNAERARSKFFVEIGNLITQFPDLGFLGRWDKLKEINPKVYWNFVLSFDASPKADMTR